jgi:polysaccharide pyruvyl transferase WcaK-like protein
MTKEMALLQGRSLVLSPQTIGPFDKALPRALARISMRRARKIFARDNESCAFVRSVDAGLHAVETVDVAFRLPFTRRPKTGSRLQFGLNVSGLLYAGGYTQKGQFGSRDAYRALVDGVIERLISRGGIDVVLVPHVVPGDGSVEDDIAVSRTLVERFPGVTLAPTFASPMEAKSFISGLDVLAGSRMHATNAAASSGVAVVPLAYSRKFRGVFQSIDYPIVGDCTTTAPQDLVDLTLSAVERRAELESAASAGSARTAQKLAVYEDFLAELFAD